MEYLKDGRPLWFSVEDERGQEYGDYMLSSALWYAITNDVDVINVYAIDKNDGESELLDSLDVTKLAKQFCERMIQDPLQYSYIKNGGFSVDE